ncbi:MAG: SdrD B-like domain-containing protein, partial [Pseudohongiellaceae bacterium]
APITGSITIVKDAQPNDGQNFTFTSDQASIAPFPLDDDSDSTLADRQTFTGLAAGSYSFTETQVSGWTLSSISCTPATNTSTNVVTGVASITLTAGANVTCTFVNSRVASGSLTIVKDSQPDNAQAFNFSTSGAGLNNFTLDDDGNTTNAFSNSVTFSNLTAGIALTVTEDAITGWTVPSLQCIPTVPGLTSIFTDQANRTFTVNLEAGANVTCTFSNVFTAPAPSASICGVKFNDLNGNGLQDAGELGLANWQISLGIAAIPPVTTGTKGEYCISGLPAGTYTLSEILQAPWLQTFPAAPGTHTVTLTAGQQVNGINFGNVIPSGLCNSLSGSTYILLSNGSFETAPLVNPGTFSFFDQSLVPSWNTTATDGLMEIWSSGFGGIPGYSGNQFLELNANVGATVYQSFTAIPGSTVTITFAHRGRAGFPNQMSVSLGAIGSLPATLGTFTASTSAWTLNSISYTFPNNGQTAYQIGFVANDTGPGGNFLDDIQMIDDACLDAEVTDTTTLSNPKVFTFVESTYPLLFAGPGVAGQSGPYAFRFYEKTNNYLAIDDMGTIFMMGDFTDNAVTELGTIVEFTTLIRGFYAGAVANSRVFDFAAGNFPEIFSGVPQEGRLDQYDYRYYPQSGNYLAIDNAGMLYILGPYSNNALVRLGEVESLKSDITAWEAGKAE